MTRDTRRDNVWRTVLELLTTEYEREYIQPKTDHLDPGELIKSDVRRQVEAGDRTVHDVLVTMVEYGILDTEERRIHVPQSRTIDGTAFRNVTVFSAASDGPIQTEPAETGGENPVNRQNPDSNPTPDADEPDSNRPEVEFPEASKAGFAESLPRIGEDKAGRLWAEGFRSYEDIFTASEESLTDVSGIGERTARAIKIRMVGSALTSMEMDKYDLPDMETATVADMFNLSESLADDLQAEVRADYVFG